MQKKRMWREYLPAATILGLLIWFDQARPQDAARTRFYGTIAEVALGAGIIAWGAFKMLANAAIVPYVGYVMMGAGLIVTQAGITTGTRATFWLGCAMLLTGLFAHKQYRNGPLPRPR